MRHVLMLVCLLVCIPSLAAENLLFNGDFEMPSAASPPPGWVMWGANQWKVPANFTRDTANAHGGQACFRIHHPADSRGYVVSSPDHPIAVLPNVAYTLTFSARASRNAQATVGFDSYQSVKPLAGFGSPATFNFDVGSEWKQYAFGIEEGLDFFATAGRFLLLRLHATRDNAAEVTLWVDDMVLTQAARPESAVRLFDENALPHEPVHHALKSGDRWEISVDAAKTIRPAQRLATGISFHRVAGWTGFPFDKSGKYTLMPQLEQAISDLKLPMTRFYYYFNRHVGSQVVQLEGTSPWYTPPADEETNPKAEQRGGPLAPALVTLSQDARALYVIAANGSWDQSLPCTMKLAHFTAKSARGVILSQPDADSPALVDKREDAISNLEVRINGDTVTFTLPGHSIGFITVE